MIVPAVTSEPPRSRDSPVSRVNAGFALRLALREWRNGFRRIGLYMLSIAVGVGGLVSIQSFREEVVDSIFDHARESVGADVRLTPAGGRLGPRVAGLLDSLAAEGTEVGFVSMATGMLSTPDASLGSLGQVVAVSGGYPFYGEVTSDPADAWTGEIGPDQVFLSTAVAAELNARPGDPLRVGSLTLEVAGIVSGIPGATRGGQFLSAIFGASVYVAPSTLERSRLLGTGTLATHEAFLVMPDRSARREFREDRESFWMEERVDVSFAEEEADQLAEAASIATRFFGVVGVAALLLGGIGVASAIHIYILEKRTSVAVLRCLGAGRWTAFLAYLIHAVGLGLGGALLGGVLGVGMQALFPIVVSGLVPVEFGVRISPAAWLTGIGIGIWVALVFALIPLLKIRKISPLEALRSGFGERGKRALDPLTILAWLIVLASALVLCVIEAPHWGVGLAFAGTLGVAIGALALAAWGITAATRKFFPKKMPYPVRQGVSNLFRPHNQTLALTIALGSGAFVIALVVVMGGSLGRAMAGLTEESGISPTVLFYNVDTDARETIEELARAEMAANDGNGVDEEGTSDGSAGIDGNLLIISMSDLEIVEINGRLYEDIVAERPTDAQADTDLANDSFTRGFQRRWTVTTRNDLEDDEVILEGEWWNAMTDRMPGQGTDDSPLRLSITEWIASELELAVGDTAVWETEGTFVATVISSVRSGTPPNIPPTTQADPTFNGVFLDALRGGSIPLVLEPGSSAAIPFRYMAGAIFDDAEANSRVQRATLAAHPEVAAFDFHRLVTLLVTVLERVRQGISLLALFAILVGLVVMVGVLATSRAQRFREGALLRTLGASRRQVLTVLLTEFVSIGTLATFCGLLLGALLAIPLIVVGTDVAQQPQVLELLGLWIGLMAATAIVGLISSRGLLSKPPLATLRGE